jgi:creatinine amidohydrolase
MPNHIHSLMSWPEFQKAMPDLEVAILPVGSQEQHGPNLGFATDAERADAMVKLLCERLYPNALALAPLNYGISPHHMNFPGTITLGPETLITTVMDIAGSLKHHGIKKILLVTGHGGNQASLNVAAGRIRFELGMKASNVGCGGGVCRDLTEQKAASEIRGHSCEVETSQTMHLVPHLVKFDELAKGELKDTAYNRRPYWGTVPWSFDEITANGALGDATKATPEFGAEMTELILDRLEDFVLEYFLGKEPKHNH